MFSSSPASADYNHSIWQKSTTQRIKLLADLFTHLRLSPRCRLLDIGAGDLSFSRFFADLFDFNVTACEPRFSGDQSEFQFTILPIPFEDLDSSNPFDIVLALGFLYHLGNPLDSLVKIANCSSEFVLIDAVVLDHDASALIFLEEEPSIMGNSISGRACRPSPGWIVGTLASLGFCHYQDLSKCLSDIPSDGTSSGHCYNWSYERTCGWRRDEMQLRKFYMFSLHSFAPFESCYSS